MFVIVVLLFVLSCVWLCFVVIAVLFYVLYVLSCFVLCLISSCGMGMSCNVSCCVVEFLVVIVVCLGMYMVLFCFAIVVLLFCIVMYLVCFVAMCVLLFWLVMFLALFCCYRLVIGLQSNVYCF